MAVGTLLVPLSALAAIALSNGADAPSGVETTTTSQPAGELVPRLDSDVQAACGESGLDLVTKEQAGSITEFQQSALDALRPICSDAGLPLPAGSTTTTPARAIEVSSAPSPTTVTTLDDRDLDHHEDDDDHGDHAEDDDDHAEDDD
jgi:hypothetical protein